MSDEQRFNNAFSELSHLKMTLFNMEKTINLLSCAITGMSMEIEKCQNTMIEEYRKLLNNSE